LVAYVQSKKVSQAEELLLSRLKSYEEYFSEHPDAADQDSLAMQHYMLLVRVLQTTPSLLSLSSPPSHECSFVTMTPPDMPQVTYLVQEIYLPRSEIDSIYDFVDENKFLSAAQKRVCMKEERKRSE
jgi:hypothetical protein